MKIYDCFMYFDEDLVLELRLNTLDKYVDYFVIVESNYNHKGDKRELRFNIDKFKKFKNKILYLNYNFTPEGIEIISEKESENSKSAKFILNAARRENGQRNYIEKGLLNAKNEDLILISDIDEIPNLSNVQLDRINKKIILFKQNMFYYKFNLKAPNLLWTGTKGCRKKYLKNPQWLRNIRDRKYPFYRLDTFFSDIKYIDVETIDNGGWHFTNIKKPYDIKRKLESYLHHREFDLNPLTTEQIEEIIKNKKAIYDLNLDKRLNKFGKGMDLEKFEIDKLPSYIKENIEKYKDWLD